MKNQLLYLLTILGMALGFSSCDSDDIFNTADTETGLVHIDVELPSGELRTRGYGDGGAVSVLKCYVYSVGSEIPMRTENVTITSSGGKRGGSLGIDLPSGGAYDFVFLATSCPQDDKNSKVYYNPSDRTLNLNYAKITGNDEDVDCFFGVLPSISIDKGQSHSVTLKRPFAQLSIGTKDLDIYNKMASAPLATVGVSVDGVYTSMNVMDGNCVGNPTKVTLAPASMPSGQTFPAKDASYLAMDYLLVKDRRDVAVSLACGNGSSSFTSLYDDIPLQRNYQTVLYGNLLTAEKDFTVEINPEFASSGNKDVDDPWADYDLVVEADLDHLNAKMFFTINKQLEFNLLDYMDSNGLIKLRWEQLTPNFSEIESFQFSKYPYAGISCLKSLVKCDIAKLNCHDLSSLFLCCYYLTNIDGIYNWDTSKITDMHSMFQECRSLTTIDMSNLNTQNVLNMRQMFQDCSKITTLDLSSIDTSNVTNMRAMFSGCSSLNNMDLTSLNTCNVTDMANMFYGCSSLNNPNLSSIDTSNVTNMRAMFSGCSSLNNLDLSSFDTSNVTDMAFMFSGCSSLNNPNLSSFDTSNVTDMTQMFYECRSLINLDLSGFHTGKVTTMYSMFYECEKLNDLDFSSFDTSNVKDMASMFSGCVSLSNLDLSSFDTCNVTDMANMFYGCNSLNNPNLSSFNTSNVTKLETMFSGCVSLSNLDLSSFDTRNVINMIAMFSGCSSLNNPNLSSFDTSNVTNMREMFSGCSSLNNLDLSSFDTTNVKVMKEMFANCYQLFFIDLSNFDTQNVTDMTNMFKNCPASIKWGSNGGLH